MILTTEPFATAFARPDAPVVLTVFAWTVVPSTVIVSPSIIKLFELELFKWNPLQVMSPVVVIWDEPCFLKLISVSLNPPQLVVDYTAVPHSFAGGGGNFPAIYAKINGFSKVTNDFKVNGFKDVHVNGIA